MECINGTRKRGKQKEKEMKKERALVHFSRENHLKFTRYLITVHISGTRYNLESRGLE